MAQRKETIVHRSSDLSGEEGADVKERRVGWDGKTYKLDLTQDETDELYGFLLRYIDAAEKAASGNTASSSTSSAPAEYDTKAIRAWAQANPDKLNGADTPGDRGKLHPSVVAAYYFNLSTEAGNDDDESGAEDETSREAKFTEPAEKAPQKAATARK